VKYLRILSDVARDADGTPLKIYAVVQDVTARETSHTALDRLSEQLRTREITALAEHRLAAQLQNLIQPVPREPVALPGLEAMIGYQPAESTIRVGGDWYHAHALANGRVVLAIGDVAGHGLAAASGMAHLRFALVSWLSIGILDPEILLGHLNRLSVQLTITATAVISVFDPAAGQLRWARAGHMPPMLARAGKAAALPAPAGILLGATESATYRSAIARLRPGDLLLFYTDGLVERRETATSTLLAKVRGTLAAFSADGADQPLTELSRRLHYASPYDDTCTLTVRVTS
jgi:serine phosphatase RsbU (regulator of sigma subunit)